MIITVDFTAQNVYKGMCGPYVLFDYLDTGDETTGLRLPSGKYDVPIFFNDFLLDDDFQLVFDLFNLDGILGDRFCANGAIQPFFDVDRRRYRLRLYNPGPSRWWEFALFDGTNFMPFWQISIDGNLLPEAVKVTSVKLAECRSCRHHCRLQQDEGVAALSRQSTGAGERTWTDRQGPFPRDTHRAVEYRCGCP